MLAEMMSSHPEFCATYVCTNSPLLASGLLSAVQLHAATAASKKRVHPGDGIVAEHKRAKVASGTAAVAAFVAAAAATSSTAAAATSSTAAATVQSAGPVFAAINVQLHPTRYVC
jgi:hypothetical protein